MNLDQLKPKPSILNLENGKSYVLRPLNIGDEIWIKQTFGSEIDKLFNENNVNLEALTRIVFHQMEDKSDFKKKEVVEFDEEGNEKTSEIGGYKLFMKSISGMKDKIEMIHSMNETIGISRPVATKENNPKDTKKKAKK